MITTKKKRTIINKISLSALVDIAKKGATPKDLNSINFLEDDIDVYICELEHEYQNLKRASGGNTDLTMKEVVVSDEWIQATTYWDKRS